MAKKQPRFNRRSAGTPRETRPAIAVTVFWTLCGVITFAAELVGLIAQLGWQITGAEPMRWAAHLFLIVAAITGSMTLLATPCAMLIRRQPIPRVIVAVSLVVAVLPYVLLLVRMM